MMRHGGCHTSPIAPAHAVEGEGLLVGRRVSSWSVAMSADLEITDAEFARVTDAFTHLRLGEDRPPIFRDFLVQRLRGGSPALADRVASASDEQVER